MYQKSQSYFNSGNRSGGCSSSYQNNQNYQSNNHSSNLEYIAQNAVSYEGNSSSPSYGTTSFNDLSYLISPFSSSTANSYNNETLTSYNQQGTSYNIIEPHREYHFIPDNFLKPGKEGTFVGKAAEIREYIEETFQKMFNQPFPADIKISVLDQKQFRKLAPSAGTIGLSINRRKQGLLSEIFVLNDYLARVMLTIGHELGHVLTPTLSTAHDEEAKAYAFSLTWMEVIKEYNIANLEDAFITENPAQNGLHNIAFNFVEKLWKQGKKIGDIYRELVKGKLSLNSSFLRKNFCL